MKKFLGFFCAIFLAIAPMANMAWGVNEDRDCTDEDGNCPDCTDFEDDFAPDNCAATKLVVVRLDDCTYRVRSCTQCNTGYVLDPDLYADGVDGCLKGCDTSTCKSDTTWTAGNTGYQKKTNRSCSGTTCVATTVYQCAAGYYGSSTNGTSGCTRCPTVSGLTGTSPAGTTAQTACYIASGTSGSDTTGKFTYTGNSYYCN